MTIAHHATRVYFLIVLSCLSGFAQTDSSSLSEFFPKVLDSLFISKNGFYLQKVTDTRSNKVNNGYFEKNLEKKRLVFHDSLPVYVASFIHPSKQSLSLVPLSIQVEKFRIFSSSDNKMDNAQIYVKLHFYDEIAHEKLRTFERTLNYRKKAEPDFIGKVVYDAFRLALSGLRPKTILKPIANPVVSSGKDSTLPEVYIPYAEVAQERNVYVIPAMAAPVVWSSEEFYLSDVKDTRSNQQNVGTVRKGFFSQKYEAELDSGVEHYLKKSISSAHSEAKKALTLYVKSLQITEGATAYGEDNNLLFIAVLAYDSLGTTVQVYENVIEIDTISDKDLTSQWPSLLNKALARYFQSFEKGKKLQVIDQNIGQNSYFNMNEIREEKFGFRERYFYQGQELKGINAFSPIFGLDADSVNNTYAAAKSLCYMGRVSVGIGAALLTWSGVDYLLSEEKSVIKWYNGGDATSTIMNFVDKKMVIHVGAAHLIGGLLCEVIGKVVLDKAVRMHNKSLAERVSFNVTPDIYHNGFQFHLNMTLGCR